MALLRLGLLVALFRPCASKSSTKNSRRTKKPRRGRPPPPRRSKRKTTNAKQDASLQRFGARVGDVDGAYPAMVAATQAPLTWDGGLSSFEPSLRPNATADADRRPVPFFLRLEADEPLQSLLPKVRSRVHSSFANLPQ